jgi:hypothetical protein
MSISIAGAHKMVHTAIAEIPRDAAEQVRALELERLNRMLDGVWPAAESGDPRAIDSVIKLMDRRSKYLGLDSPLKVETNEKSPLDLIRERLMNGAAKVDQPS